MRIDLPQCGFHYCRFQFDGNCTSKSKHKNCEYRYLNAQPERKKGRWIDSSDVWMCSECGKWLDVLQGDADMNFCPNCGADMRGEHDE